MFLRVGTLSHATVFVGTAEDETLYSSQGLNDSVSASHNKVDTSAKAEAPTSEHQLKRSLGLFDSTMLVAGSMIGSGIFIVSSEMARNVGSPGWLLLSWVITGVLTLTAALSYGESLQ